MPIFTGCVYFYDTGMARQGKLKRHDGSEVNAMAAKMSVNASLPSLHDKSYSPLGLCVPQAILEENPVFHIRDRNKQRHGLLHRYACKRVRHEREASRFHNSWNSCSMLPKYIRNYLRRSEIQNFPGVACPRTPFMRSAYFWNPPANFCLRPCVCYQI